MDVQEGVVKTVKDFAKGSVRLVKRCSKPDRKGEAPGDR
jgi:preprotein translocase subunit Sss1